MNNRVNLLTIDVEAWFSDLKFERWKNYKDRIVQNTTRILNILKERRANATFFILGYFAEKYPELIEKIIDENHEIGTHGHTHLAITELRQDEFQEDLVKSIKTLEKISKEKVWGHRAPFFTIVEDTSWAIEIMKKIGLKYDSSIFPFKIYKYGVPDIPLFPYHISSKNIKKDDIYEEFLEFPPSVYKIPIINKNIPIAGGFYLRFFPYSFISYGIKKINKKGSPAVCYTHPWEFDLNHPRINSIVWYNYYRLNATEKKFKKLLRDFKFTSIRDWIERR